MISDPFKLRLAYLIKELGLAFPELAIAQIWTPTHVPFTGVRDGKLDTQVMQTGHHPTYVGDAAFLEFRAKSCKQGITGQALGMLGKVWCSGVLQVVQDVAIVPLAVHPRNKLEHLRKGPCGTGLMQLLAEIVYIPIYDETDPDTGVTAVVEILISAVGRESLLANVISGVGNVLAELQLSLSMPDPDAEVPLPGSLPPQLVPSEPGDMAVLAAAESTSPRAIPEANPFASVAGVPIPSVPEHSPLGAWRVPCGGRQHSSPRVSPRQSSLRSYGTSPHPLIYGSPPTGPIRYGFLETPVLVPRPGSPLPSASSDVMAALGDFAGMSFTPPATHPARAPACDWAAVAARTSAAGGLTAAKQMEASALSASLGPQQWGSHPTPKATTSPRASLTRTLSRTSTRQFLDAMEQDAAAMPLPCTKPYQVSKGFAALHRHTLPAGL